MVWVDTEHIWPTTPPEKEPTMAKKPTAAKLKEMDAADARKLEAVNRKKKAAAAKKKATAEAAADPNGDTVTPDPKTGALFETQKISRGLKILANKYAEASIVKSQGLSTFNSARDALIDKMKDEGVERVLVEMGGVRKAVHVEETDVLKLETVKDDTPAAGPAGAAA